jgi:hypothetical protein
MMHSQDTTTTAAEIRRLRDLLAERDAEIEQLRAAITGDLRTPIAWGLTATEERFVLALRHGRVMTYEALMTAIYQLSDTEPAIKTITTHLSKIRTKLHRRAPGIRIDTVWGRGLVLAPISVPVLAEALHAPEAPVRKSARRPPKRRTWTDEQTAQLVDLTRSGRTSAQIAEAMTRICGRPVTHSAVRNELSRLGIRQGARHA